MCRCITLWLFYRSMYTRVVLKMGTFEIELALPPSERILYKKTIFEPLKKILFKCYQVGIPNGSKVGIVLTLTIFGMCF